VVCGKQLEYNAPLNRNVAWLGRRMRLMRGRAGHTNFGGAR